MKNLNLKFFLLFSLAFFSLGFSSEKTNSNFKIVLPVQNNNPKYGFLEDLITNMLHKLTMEVKSLKEKNTFLPKVGNNNSSEIESIVKKLLEVKRCLHKRTNSLIAKFKLGSTKYLFEKETLGLLTNLVDEILMLVNSSENSTQYHQFFNKQTLNGLDGILKWMDIYYDNNMLEKNDNNKNSKWWLLLTVPRDIALSPFKSVSSYCLKSALNMGNTVVAGLLIAGIVGKGFGLWGFADPFKWALFSIKGLAGNLVSKNESIINPIQSFEPNNNWRWLDWLEDQTCKLHKFEHCKS